MMLENQEERMTDGPIEGSKGSGSIVACLLMTVG